MGVARAFHAKPIAAAVGAVLGLVALRRFVVGGAFVRAKCGLAVDGLEIARAVIFFTRGEVVVGQSGSVMPQPQSQTPSL